MAENNFKGTVEALFHGMDAVIVIKTVVGDTKSISEIRSSYRWWMCHLR